MEIELFSTSDTNQKKIIRKIVFRCLFCCALFSSQLLLAQGESNETNDPNTPASEQRGEIDLGIEFEESLVQDGAYEKTIVREKVALPYDHIREADVLFSKRLWRVIDTNEKINKKFVNEDVPFIKVLLDIVQKNADVRIFEDDRFTIELDPTEIKSKLATTDTVSVYDMDTDDYVTEITVNEFNPTVFSKFRLKEDWVFDEETSRMVGRIMAIAPVRDVYDDASGEYRGQESLFWMYYPTVRPYLAKYESPNIENSSNLNTWEDVMEMRYFSSYVIKEDRDDGASIRDQGFTGRDALRESDKINSKLYEREHDVWSY